MNFDRRNLLKGLLTLPGAAAVGGLMISCGKNEEKSTPKTEASPDSSKTAVAATTTVDFSVVLHGSYAIQFDTDNAKVQILIPTVLEGGKEAHKYLRGLFKAEQPFAPKENSAISVSTKNSLPDVLTKDPGKFVIIRKKDLKQASGSPPRNRFELPYPRALTVLRAQEFKTTGHSFFDNDGLIAAKPTQVPLTLALQYDLIVPGSFPVPKLHLHIFAEPDKRTDGKHIKTAFTALASLYKGNLGGLQVSKEICDDADMLLKTGSSDDDSILKEIKLARTGFEPDEGLSLMQRTDLAAPTGGGRVGGCAAIITVTGNGA